MYSGSEPQTSQPQWPLQGAGPRGSAPKATRRSGQPFSPRRSNNALRLTTLAIAALLSGCGSVPATFSPVTWWHDLEGGVIAEQRPPPPGANDPFPNLASIPPRPAPLDPAIREAINRGLVADRANAQHEASATPIPDLTAGAASPGQPDAGKTQAAPTAPPSTKPSSPPAAQSAAAPPPAEPPAQGLSASFAAASAPPAPPAPTPTPAAPTGDTTVLGSQPEGSIAQMGPLPPLPNAPPPPANLPGANPPPPPAPPAPPPPPTGAPPPPGSVSVPFAQGASTPSADAGGVLHGLAIQRKETTGVVVIGYGDAADSDPATQAAALTLAVQRAQAVTTALIAQGVPAAAVASVAQAEGRGAAVRLVN